MSSTLAGLGPLAQIMGDASGATPEMDGSRLSIVSDDGDVRITIGPPEAEETNWNDNLASKFDTEKLSACANRLIQDIDTDNQARQKWLDNRTQGLALLGLELLDPRGDVGASTSPLEGMSTVVAPLLLGEVLRAQATARSQLLPAEGPVKILDGSSVRTGQRDEMADKLERDINTYLTEVCTEYYPDTDRMLFNTVFGGAGFKKIFHCPIRNRPVSESVDAADLIINPGATDMRNARRITHVIKMRDSEVRRWVLAGVWRDVNLGPAYYQVDPVVEKKGEILGIQPQPQQPSDQDRTIYEVCCEWDFGEGPEGMPVPYRITLDKDSRQILDIRRNWEEDDSLFRAQQLYVRFPYIDAVGIYGIGLLNVLGNTAKALTGAWREMMDAGMFANFPGFLYADTVARQETNEFRIPPGGGVKVQTGGLPLADAVMPLPYKSIAPTLLQFCQYITEVSKQTAGAAEIPLGEGKAQMPVGTILAMLEQATVAMSAVHKRLHAAQAEEFRLLVEKLREDPEAFWRHGKRQVYAWDKETFIQALNTFELTPVADPNDPTRSHRIIKAMGIKTLQQMNPTMYDAERVDSHLLRLLGVGNPQEFFTTTPPMPPPNPMLEVAKVKAATEQGTLAQKDKDARMRLVETQVKAQQSAADRQSKEKIEAEKLAVERQKIGADVAVESTKGMHQAMQPPGFTTETLQ